MGKFEAANPRPAHEWLTWSRATIPDEKVLVPGLLTSTSNYVEHPELIAQRICVFADIVGRERVLAALAQGARRASARLWP
jgi:5-methyltetrahydropteroyltriglutamate--homocysteine methyltransferase